MHIISVTAKLPDIFTTAFVFLNLLKKQSIVHIKSSNTVVCFAVKLTNCLLLVVGVSLWVCPCGCGRCTAVVWML